MKSAIAAFEKYETAVLNAQQIQAKSSLEAGEEHGAGIGSPVNSLQRERALMEAAFKREAAKAEFFKALILASPDKKEPV